MKEYIGKNAGAVGVITAMLFAYVIWVYLGKGYSVDTSYLIVAGLALITLNIITLYCSSTSKVTKKAVKKIITKKKGAKK